MKKLAPLAAAIIFSAAASNAMADTGTVTINGTINSATCTIGNMSPTVDFAEKSTSELQELAQWTKIETKYVRIPVTGCSASGDKAVLTLAYTPYSSGWGIQNTGDAEGVTIFTNYKDASGPAAGIPNGGTVESDLDASGNTTLEFEINTQRTKLASHGGADDVKAGTLAGTIDLAMTFE